MVERQVWALFAVLASFGLSGCFGGGHYSQASVQQPGQEILDGTIRNPTDWADAAPRRATRQTAKVTIGTVGAGTDVSAAAEPPKVYSDEWWAKESRNNERLKSRMTICRGC